MKRLIQVAVMLVMLCAFTTNAHSRDYWGAFVSAMFPTTNSGYTSVFGVAWNYPSMTEAVESAIAACNKRSRSGLGDCFPRHSGHLAIDLIIFSTFMTNQIKQWSRSIQYHEPYSGPNAEWTIKAHFGSTWRSIHTNKKRCIAINSHFTPARHGNGSEFFYIPTVGDTKTEALNYQIDSEYWEIYEGWEHTDEYGNRSRVESVQCNNS